MGMGEKESRMRKEAVERERNCSGREIGEEAEWKTIQGAACGIPIERVSVMPQLQQSNFHSNLAHNHFFMDGNMKYGI